MSLITLVYVSVATKMMDDSQLRQILADARDNNQKLDVTGMLLYRDGLFIQALEGDQETVEKLFTKISTDPRHNNILKVYQEPIVSRSFANWTMGFNKLGDSQSEGMESLKESLEGYTDFLEKPDMQYFLQQPNRARILLESFKESIYF